jgi:hypothetical protein
VWNVHVISKRLSRIVRMSAAVYSFRFGVFERANKIAVLNANGHRTFFWHPINIFSVLYLYSHPQVIDYSWREIDPLAQSSVLCYALYVYPKIFLFFTYVLVVYFCSFKIRIRIRNAERKVLTNIPPNRCFLFILNISVHHVESEQTHHVWQNETDGKMKNWTRLSVWDPVVSKEAVYWKASGWKVLKRFVTFCLKLGISWPHLRISSRLSCQQTNMVLRHITI